MTRFMDYYSPFWGPKAISIVVEPNLCLRVGRQDSQFGQILARFLDYYSVLGSRSDFHDRRTMVCLCVRHQHLQFWPILARLMDYYSLISGP